MPKNKTMELIPFVDRIISQIEQGNRSPEAGPKWSFLRFLEGRAGL